MIEAKVTGLPDLKAALAGIVPKLRVRALRTALAAAARVVQREARVQTPVLNPGALAVRKGYRTPGLVRKQISVRTSKLAVRSGDVGVFVNVRPAKGARFKTTTSSVLGLKVRTRRLVSVGQRGAKSPNDPFYWRFIEFGTKSGTRAWSFLRKGANKLPEALQIFIRAIGPQIEKLNKPKAPAP